MKRNHPAIAMDRRDVFFLWKRGYCLVQSGNRVVCEDPDHLKKDF